MYAHCVSASGGHDFKSGCFRIWTPYSLILAKSLPVRDSTDLGQEATGAPLNL